MTRERLVQSPIRLYRVTRYGGERDVIEAQSAIDATYDTPDIVRVEVLYHCTWFELQGVV
jgi:hypothetical protein